MKAGREIDAMIAEKVMGWEYDKQTDVYKKPDGEFITLWRFKPSTNIADAWLVVEKLIKMGGEIDIRVSPLGVEVETSEALEQGLSAPYLICLSALKELGVEVDG